MFTQDFEHKYIAPIIAFLGAYEAIAITSRGRIPTISRIVWKIYSYKSGKIGVWLTIGWLADHLMVPPEMREALLNNMEELIEGT